jgi:hypothetical protein
LRTSLAKPKPLLVFAALSTFPKLERLSLGMRNIRMSPDRQIYHGFGHVLFEKYFIPRSLDSKQKFPEIDIEKSEDLKEMVQYIYILAKQEKEYPYQEIKLSVSHWGNMWSADYNSMTSIDDNHLERSLPRRE